ncbi:MAG: HD family phosphohydrolase [Dehalococcoidia bacterium]
MYLSKHPWQALAAAVFAFAIVMFIALLPVVPRGTGVEEGKVASRTIRAPKDISFTSEALTQRRQDEAAKAVLDVKTFDENVASQQQAELNLMLTRMRLVLAGTAPEARPTALSQIDKLNISGPSMQLLQNMAPGDFASVEGESRRALGGVYFNRSFSQEDVQGLREQAVSFVDPFLGREASTLIAELIRPFIISNEVVDTVRTEQQREAARASVAPVQVSFAENQIIVEKDQPITPEAREALLEAELIGNIWTPELLGGTALLAIVAAITVITGLRVFRPKAQLRDLILVGGAISIPVFIIKAYLPLILPDDERHFLAYILPVSVSSMVLAGFVGAEVALMGAAMIAFLTAFIAVLLLDVTVVGIAGSLEIARLALVSGIAGAAGVFAVRNAERLAHFLIGGVLVGACTFTILVATWLLDPNRELNDLAWMLLAAFANGGLSAFISAGIFVTLGSVLGITTRLQLLEMSQLSSPLLLRLQDEAPSTFQHSVIVANLAEKGAHVIGADALVARVGCYYHDIGKLIRPGFFIENQLGGANPHDALDPFDSARIISDHVRDGLALAAEYKVPSRIADFIPEHHGTRLVTYFYRQASKDNPALDPELFRYPGPKPQSRETAIAMLADSTEATVRSSSDKTPERINALVDQVFNERLVEGELDESGLTLNDIKALAQSFKATLRAVYHPRIEYPAPSEAELLLRSLPVRSASGE